MYFKFEGVKTYLTIKIRIIKLNILSFIENKLNLVIILRIWIQNYFLKKCSIVMIRDLYSTLFGWKKIWEKSENNIVCLV